MKLIGQKTYPNTEAGYLDAERFADEWAGDNCGFAVVIEDTENDQLHVMDQANAAGFTAEWESRVIYGADQRLRCHTCEKHITGQRIGCRDHNYCSFVCLDNYIAAKRTRLEKETESCCNAPATRSRPRTGH